MTQVTRVLAGSVGARLKKRAAFRPREGTCRCTQPRRQLLTRELRDQGNGDEANEGLVRDDEVMVGQILSYLPWFLYVLVEDRRGLFGVSPLPPRASARGASHLACNSRPRV